MDIKVFKLENKMKEALKNFLDFSKTLEKKEDFEEIISLSKNILKIDEADIDTLNREFDANLPITGNMEVINAKREFILLRFSQNLKSKLEDYIKENECLDYGEGLKKRNRAKELLEGIKGIYVSVSDLNYAKRVIKAQSEEERKLSSMELFSRLFDEISFKLTENIRSLSEEERIIKMDFDLYKKAFLEAGRGEESEDISEILFRLLTNIKAYQGNSSLKDLGEGEEDEVKKAIEDIFFILNEKIANVSSYKLKRLKKAEAETSVFLLKHDKDIKEIFLSKEGLNLKKMNLKNMPLYSAIPNFSMVSKESTICPELLSALAGIINYSVTDLKENLWDNGDFTATLKLYSLTDSSNIYVTLDKSLPMSKLGENSSFNGNLFLHIIDKALKIKDVREALGLNADGEISINEYAEILTGLSTWGIFEGNIKTFENFSLNNLSDLNIKDSYEEFETSFKEIYTKKYAQTYVDIKERVNKLAFLEPVTIEKLQTVFSLMKREEKFKDLDFEDFINEGNEAIFGSKESMIHEPLARRIDEMGHVLGVYSASTKEFFSKIKKSIDNGDIVLTKVYNYLPKNHPSKKKENPVITLVGETLINGHIYVTVYNPTEKATDFLSSKLSSGSVLKIKEKGREELFNVELNEFFSWAETVFVIC